MTYTLKEAFDEAFETLEVDKQVAHELYQYQFGFINRNSDHLEFFGGNLIGVQVIRFKDADVSKFFNDVIDQDFAQTTQIVRQVTTIDHSFKISGDILNLSLMYLLHRIYNSPKLTEPLREAAAYNTALIFFYRCICAICSDWFRYPADERIAQKAYANLSNKFLIKQLGSWIKVMEYRAKDLINKKGLHREAITKFTDDYSIVYAINDSQNRIRDLVKNYYSEFKQVHDDGESIGRTSSTIIDLDGEESTREKTKSVESYVTYAQHLVIDPPGFIRDDLISVIIDINTNTSSRMVKATLTWICEKYHDPKYHRQIDRFLQMVVTQTMHLIEYSISPSKRKDLPHVLQSLKNLYLSTRSTDPELLIIRDLGQELVIEASGKISKSLMMATRLSLILYISLRVIVGKGT